MTEREKIDRSMQTAFGVMLGAVGADCVSWLGGVSLDHALTAVTVLAFLIFVAGLVRSANMRQESD